MVPSWLRTLAYITIGSGLLGLFGLFEVAGAVPGFSTSASFPLGIAFFGWAIWASAQTLRLRRDGLRALYLVQVVQIIAFSIGWRVVARVGVVGQLLLASAGFRLEGGWQNQFVLTSLHDGALRAAGTSFVVGAGIIRPEEYRDVTWTIGVNVVALYFAVRLWH